MVKTNDILKKYGITRQTLANWTKFYGLNIKRGINGRYLWDKESLDNMEKFVELQLPLQKESEQMNDTFDIENRRYLGSKTRMLDFIDSIVAEYTKNVHEVADIFGGTGVVANSFYKQGFNIIVNDILDSNYLSYRTFFGNEKIRNDVIDNKIRQMNNIHGTFNYVSRNYGNKYFSESNAIKIGAAREFIDQQKDINDRERDILLTSLLYAMEEIKFDIAYDREKKFIEKLPSIMPKESLIEILPLFKNREDKKIMKKTTQNATVPTIFEWIIAIAWYYISKNNKLYNKSPYSLLDSMNLLLDSDWFPVNQAAGQKSLEEADAGDITVKYKKNGKYNDHIVQIEATLMDKNAIKRGEWEPVLRHSANLTADSNPIPVQTYFVTSHRDKNTENIWRSTACTDIEETAKRHRPVRVIIYPIDIDSIVSWLKSDDINDITVWDAVKKSYDPLINQSFDNNWSQKILNEIG